MKFVCDKCKTRYSIGDDRVRGKILKIRCKNCANVITVREGMDAVTGTVAPSVGAPALSPAPSLGAPRPGAPANLPTLEWYVSIEGVQSGPMSLADAQHWISAKPFEADLHCWNEGFDDWISVDKVSQFRNLRKPRTPSAVARPTRPPLPEKPLFASTMASIEKEASGPRAAAARANGIGHVASPSMQLPAIPPSATNAGGGVASARSSQMPHSSPAFPEKPEPQRRNAFDFGGGTGALPAIPAVEPAPPAPVNPALDDDNDDLAIGEVSRVVKLADLVPKTRSKAPSASPAQPRVGTATGSAARISSPQQFRTGSQPRMLRPSELGMNVNPALVSGTNEPTADASIVARSFRERHRRGMLALIALAAVLVLGVIGAVVFVVSKDSNEVGGGLGGGTVQIDTSRPEDIIRRQVALVENGSAGKPVPTQIKPRNTGKAHVNNSSTQVAEDPDARSLQSTEVEDMAAKQGEGTKRCYMRAQKGAMGFEIGDIKKIAVTLSVAKDGAVSSVQLSSHGTTSFGQCLIARIKAWKFRESPGGGTFRISLAFSS